MLHVLFKKCRDLGLPRVSCHDSVWIQAICKPWTCLLMIYFLES